MSQPQNPESSTPESSTPESSTPESSNPSDSRSREQPSPSDDPTIRLDQFLKWKGLADSGGQAKVRIQAGEVEVDGAVETRRSRRLRNGARVTIDGQEHCVELERR